MFTSGIVAEYNPFHNGHKYMIERTRQQGATHVVAVMSGAVVQRGDVAVFDKHFRAAKALENGVDLVIELPFPYSCAGGEIFARSSVRILAGLGRGVIDCLSFGCEIDNISLLKKAAHVSRKLSDSELVRKNLMQGMNYPAAVGNAACKIFGDDVGEVFKSPNNTLAVEYIKAAEKLMPNADLTAIKRRYAGHDTDESQNGIASGSYIRKIIETGNIANIFCPYSIDNVPVFFIKNMEREILFRLGCVEKQQLEQLPDCSSETADRIINVMSQCPKSIDDFFSMCKSKNITMARLRRIVMCYILGAKKEDMFTPPFVRVLAFNKKGAEILGKCGGGLPIGTSLKTLENSSVNAKRIIKLENNAVRFQAACAEGEYSPENEYRRIVKITDRQE